MSLIQYQNKLTDILNIIDLSKNNKRLSEIDYLLSDNSIWLDNHKATILLKERENLSKQINFLTHHQEQFNFFSELEKTSPRELDIFSQEINQDLSKLMDFHLKLMFSETDNFPAILTINSGAGGLEAMNFVSLLLRMYLRYADIQQFQSEILDMERSEEDSSNCISSVSIKISGDFAYGYLKNERGVHRLVRNSPYNADQKRQTSFAAIDVSPDIEKNMDIQINEKDLEITAMRAGGTGGQHQNKTNSAIRLKHLPTGINIAVRQERDQHANRKIALSMLKAKLYQLEQDKQNQAAQKLMEQKTDISFGNQIRSYTQSPQAIVKDHRSNLEIRDFNNVLDGNIHPFIMELLKGYKK